LGKGREKKAVGNRQWAEGGNEELKMKNRVMKKEIRNIKY
jgi:hypothetical protein